MNKKSLILYIVLIYLTIISIFTSVFLIESIDEIWAKGNVLLMISLLINLTIAIFNILLFTMNRRQKDYRLILLFNSVYSLIYGVGIRIAGIVIINYLGFNFSLLYIHNDGSTIQLNYGSFNIILKFFKYDKMANPGFSFDINLIMLLISIVLFYFYNSIKRSEKLAIG